MSTRKVVESTPDRTLHERATLGVPTAGPERDHRGARVLIVDDNADHLVLLRALLEGKGFIVESARDGAEALAQARAALPDLVIADLLMPVMDGYTLLRQWRADARLREIPFIVYTATYTEPLDEHFARSLGADAFLIKPTDHAVLLELVRTVLAAAAAGTIRRPTEPPPDDHLVLREYNEVLVRKVEQKALQLEATNRDLLREIAERRRADAEAGRASRLLQAVSDGTSDAIFVKDPDGTYLYCNEATARAVGRTVEEVLGRNDSAFFGPDDAGMLRANDLQVLATGHVITQDEHVVAAGRARVFQALKAPYRDEGGKVIGVIGVARDITERRRTEETLRLRDRAISHVSQGILITDHTAPGDPIIFASAGFSRMTGYGAEEVLGMNSRFLQGKDTDPETVRTLREAIADGRACAVELLNYRKDGTPFWNALSVNPVLSEAGVIDYHVSVQVDITARKHLEEQLRQAQKMESVGRLAGGIAHDFNNLLTVITGYSGELLVDPSITADVREAAQAIHDAGDRAAGLTRQLLTFSRKAILRPQIVDVNALVGETGELLRRLIGEDIHLSTVLDPACRRVRVDPGQFDQVLMNLAVNARDAMPQGGILTIETHNVELTAEHATTHLDCRPGEYVMLAMTDTGVGMTPEVLTRVFEPFFTTKESGRGTGLGLAMVFGIVQQSEGGIHVYSEPGLGTTVKIYLPAVSQPTSRTSHPVSVADLRGTETILVVEDDAGVRALASKGLQMQGYRVVTAKDGTEALRVAQQHAESIDLLVTDVVMPNVSGPKLAARLQAERPTMKVLFMSGYTDESVVRHGLLEASVAFIQKPYSPRALARRVREVLDASGSDAPGEPATTKTTGA